MKLDRFYLFDAPTSNSQIKKFPVTTTSLQSAGNAVARYFSIPTGCFPEVELCFVQDTPVLIIGFVPHLLRCLDSTVQKSTVT